MDHRRAQREADENPQALDEHLREIAHRNGQGAALFLAGFVAALWPTDWVVFHAHPEARHLVAWMRAVIIVVALVAWAVLRATRLGARRPLLSLASGGAVIMLGVGLCLGRLGGPEEPWLHLAYPALFFTVLAPTRRLPRALFVSALTLALYGGFFAVRPGDLLHPMTMVSLSFALSTGALVIAVGHLSFLIIQRSFYQSLALERATRELAELNGTLESRVETQTRDLRRLATHLERAREEERAHVARELHDELGQELTALNLALSLTQQRFQKDPQCIRGNLAELEALLQRTRATTRNLVADLRPRLLDELGLTAAVAWLVRQTEARSGLQCRLDAGEVPALSDETRTVVFRVVQEALTNVVRHAGARAVEVTLRTEGRRLELRVADDGAGVAPERTAAGFGLLGIRERVTAQGGRLALEGRPGGGTILRVELPVEEART